MCLLDFVICFHINYKCEYGKSVFVIGNTESLGKWNPAKAHKLTWTHGDNWIGRFKSTHDNTKLIEYKYIIADTNNKQGEVHRWEEGPNRQLDLLKSSKLFIRLKDRWETQKVRICLHDKAIKDHEKFEKKVVLMASIGNEVSKVETKLKQLSPEGNAGQEWFWSGSLYIPLKSEGFRYKFQIINELTKEREDDRHYRRFVTRKMPLLESNTEFYTIKAAKKVKFDYLFPTELNYSMITDRIFLGSFPQNQKDIDQLKSKGITGILNLQTEYDMERAGLDFDLIKNYYKQEKMTSVHFPIPDIEPKNIMDEIMMAGDTMKSMLETHEKIYVHCTAGRNRSPNVVAYYLWAHAQLELKNAIELLRVKRDRIKISETPFLENVLNSVNKGL